MNLDVRFYGSVFSVLQRKLRAVAVLPAKFVLRKRGDLIPGLPGMIPSEVP